MKRFLIALTAFAAMAAAPAYAQDNARLVEHLRSADSNNDGAVSRSEFLQFRATQFDRIDRNSDGVISADDVPRFAARRADAQSPEQMIAQLDANHDGRVSQAEFVNGPTPIFDSVDTDRNNLATEAEFNAAATRYRAAN